MGHQHDMPETSRLVTAEELERLPKEDTRYELVGGRLVRMSPVGYDHGRVVMKLGFLISRHLDGRNLGAIVSEVGVTLARCPDTVRAPDLAFIRRDRIPSPAPRGFLHIAPDLAVEVLSPDDRAPQVREKVGEYLRRGVPLVVVVDPASRTVGIHRLASAAVLLSKDDDRIDLDEAIDGFSCTLAEIFA